MWFLGVDWSEEHHDVCLMDESGAVLASKRITDTLAGGSQLQALVAEHASSPDQVVVGIETDRGLLVSLLVASGYVVYAVNPLSVSRYRNRNSLTKAKSDAADARLLADLVRTDRQRHKPLVPSTPLGEAVSILARNHQRLIWSRQRQLNQLRSSLREFYPGALSAFDDVGSKDALAILGAAPTPVQGRALTYLRVMALLRRGGRQRNVVGRAQAIRAVLAEPSLELPAVVVDAYGASVSTMVGVVASYTKAIADLEKELHLRFRAHPDADIILTLPGLGETLGARVLAGFGDGPKRYADSRARKNYAGSSPITDQSGQHRFVHARFPRNTWLADLGFQWAFCSLRSSPGARAYYDVLRARRHSRNRALRALANRWFGILHACLRDHCPYSETIAWQQHLPALAA